jgi:hypothetical protein
MLAFKILSMLWPFIKEMLFGQMTAAQILKQHKKLVAVVVVTGLLFASNVFLTKRLVGISHDYIVLKKKYEELEKATNKKAVPELRPPLPNQAALKATVETMPEFRAAPTKRREVKKPQKAPPSSKELERRRYEQLHKSLTELQNDRPAVPGLEPQN